MATMAPKLLIDLTPLRDSRDFRRLFTGQSVSMVGNQLTLVAVAFQVYALTGSSFQVGAVSVAQLLPFVAGALAGGTVGDRFDRRHILATTSALLMVASGGLSLNALAGRQASLVAIYVITAAAAGLTGIMSTAVTAAVPSLVAGKDLTPAYAAMQVIDQIGMVLGPALSGLVIAVVGLAGLYAIDAATFAWTALLLWSMTGVAPAGSRTARPGLRSVTDGLRYLKGRQDLQSAYLLDLCATVFGLPRALFPAVAHSVFHRGPVALGLLYAAPSAGALVGSLTSGWLGGVRRQGQAVIVAVMGWGVVIIVFGFVRVFWVALALLAVAGWFDLVSAVLRSTIVQTAVDGSFRSRISSLQMAVVEGGPRLGDLESGVVATAVSTGFSIVSGGIVCVLGAVAVAALRPRFRRYGRDPGPP